MVVSFNGGYTSESYSDTETITAQNSFTEAILPDISKPMNLSVSGTFSATVVLQRSFDSGSTWHDVASYTAATEQVIDVYEMGVLWRAGVKTGGYTSGTAVVRLSQ